MTRRHEALFRGKYVAQEARRGQDRAADHQFATNGLPRFVPISNLDFKTGIAPPSSKFGNVKTDGFDSKREARRAAELRLLERSGAISNLRFQVQYVLIPAQYEGGKCVERACTYEADFVYHKDGETIVEDAKGFPNDRWPIKRKLMLFVHRVRVREV